jgi:hypothetical protein
LPKTKEEIMFCPLIRGECRDSLCVMWKDEKCLIIALAEKYSQSHIFEAQASDRVKLATAEELAEDLVSFIRKDYQGETSRFSMFEFDSFWQDHNVGRWRWRDDIEPEMAIKLEKAEDLATKQFDHEDKIRRKSQAEREKAQLHSFTDVCVDWARDRGLKSVTKADLQTFLMEKEIDILPETQKALYLKTNTELRTKR